MAPQQQLVKLIRSGMVQLASRPRAEVYCAASRGNLHLIPVKIIDSPRIPNNIFLSPHSLYANISENKPFAEAAVGAPSRPLKNTLRLGFSRNSSFGFKDEQELYRI
ncbi:uncharacterized protein [Venturia canescens]|uniref:uncharacterized protein n=1 Tax=Venturia canescens TaxID=32260 RepID=UPI001C9C2968|nr:uncharacterized protein LOC122409423 [Venturia canescens]